MRSNSSASILYFKKYLILEQQQYQGIITSAIGIFLSFLITGAAFYLVFSNPDYRQQLNDMSQQMYGETFDDMLKERGLDL